jgi:hypothetical protein
VIRSFDGRLQKVPDMNNFVITDGKQAAVRRDYWEAIEPCAVDA